MPLRSQPADEFESIDISVEVEVIEIESAEDIAGALNGWVLCWKPIGCTSYDIIRWIKGAMRGLKPKPKIGHTGTLDPFAEGLLLIALGKATRLIPYLESWHKSYVATVELGTTTATLDPTGEVTATAPVPTLDQIGIDNTLSRLVGQIWQIPPEFSAIKQGGEALYKKARRGETIEVPPRLVDIDDIVLLDRTGNQLTIEVTCGPGTYIRSLARDLGVALGTVAYCSALQRTALNEFTTDNAWHIAGPEEVTLEALMHVLRPLDTMLSEYPFASLGCTATTDFGRGNRCVADTVDSEDQTVPQAGGPIRAYSATGDFIGMALLESANAPYVIQPRAVLVAPEVS
ncbi:MAG: tRNA pseudouridine(55) synthase TruB [bacterium]